MADDEHLRILKRGVDVWNRWRDDSNVIAPDISNIDLYLRNFSNANFSNVFLNGATITRAHLVGANLNGANLSGANLYGANLYGADLSRANLGGADLNNADLGATNLSGAHLGHANLTYTKLIGADLRSASLGNADLFNADLCGANLSYANLDSASFRQTIFGATIFDKATTVRTIFADLDFREAIGLEKVRHQGPSEVSISTLYRSEGRIPEVFLQGCGVPESFITQIRALVASAQPIQFYSCFISYSGSDEEFAKRLHARMREAELRVWFAPEDMKGGDKIYDQIDHAIQLHDRLLLVLSESSMRSKWVETEIRRARKVELREGRRKLFPIRLVSYEALQEWMCIDSAAGEDLAEEVRSYYIPDFSNWKNHDDFEQAFTRLLADLKASA